MVRLEDLAWAYKKVTQHRTNFVPTGKTFEAVLWDRYGNNVEVQLSDADVNALLTLVMERVPWCVGGYDPELLKFWNTDRNGFLAAVDARRKEVKEPSRTDA